MDYETGYFDDRKNKHEEEVAIQKWIHIIFGGDIKGLSDKGDELSPDFLWNNELWELKTLNTTKQNTIEKRVGYGIKQIFESPRNQKAGGIIIDYSQSDLAFEDAKAITVEKAIKKSKGEFDVIVKKDEKYKVYKIQKKIQAPRSSEPETCLS